MSSLFNRTFDHIEDRRQRLLSGKINCIPWGLPRFEEESPGIEQGKSYCFTANSKVGKSQITDWLCLFNPIQQIIDNNLNIKLKIFYFSLEMTAQEKMLSAFSNILFLKEGIRLSPKELKSTKKDKILDDEILDIIKKYEKYFKKIEEIVTFIDDVRRPTHIYKTIESYALENGTTYYKDINTKDGTIKSFDYYVPNDPDEYVMCIVDHISLIDSEKFNGQQLNLRESMGVLSSKYFVKLRNRYNYIPIVVQQQASSQESIENAKAGKLRPTLDGLADNKALQRDYNVVLGLFSPFRHEIPNYFGYDITFFRDNIRFLEVLANRGGGAGVIAPLFFDGAVNYFKELPSSKNEILMNKVKKLILKMR